MHCVIITNKFTGRSYVYPVIYTSDEAARTAIKEDIPQAKHPKGERPRNTLEVAEIKTS